MKKIFLKIFILLLMFSQLATAQNKEPNVLFILINNFAWMDVGYNASKFYKTPEMDQLAKDSMCLDNCCTPSSLYSPIRTCKCHQEHNKFWCG